MERNHAVAGLLLFVRRKRTAALHSSGREHFIRAFLRKHSSKGMKFGGGIPQPVSRVTMERRRIRNKWGMCVPRWI